MRDSDIVKIQRELSEVAAAVRVMGTRRPKMYAMAKLVEPVAKGLTAKRPEVASVGRELHQAAQRVRSVTTRPRAASEALQGLSSVLDKVRGVLRQGYGTDKPASVPPFTVIDRWGLTRREFFRLVDVLKGAQGVLAEFGLRGLLDGATVVIDPTMLTGEMVWYVPGAGNEFVVSPNLERQHDVFVAVADRALDSVMSQRDKKEWLAGGQRRGRREFARGFVDFLEGNTLDDEVYDRLEKTLLAKV